MGLREKLAEMFGGGDGGLEHIFDNITGQEDAKLMLRMCIQSTKPVNILLKGPFGIAKTEMMLDVQKYVGKKNSHWALGSRTSKAGLGNLLLEHKNIEYLFIDEMETMNRKDQAVLLSVTEQGIVSETLFGKMREGKVSCKVIASSNDTRKLDRALLTRFAVVNMDGYDEDEFAKIAVERCKLEENITPEVADTIARIVYNKFYEPTARDVVKVARLSHGNEDDIADAIRILSKKSKGKEQPK